MAVPPGRFGAVLTAMITPFDDEGRLDVDGAATLARWLVDNGSDGLVVCGTTGESPVLTHDEKLQLWETVANAVTVPVVAGSTTFNTAESVDLTKEAEQCGAAAILAVTPYYSRPSQAGLEAHFTAIAEATELPVLLYDIPIRTGRKIDEATILRLAQNTKNIVGVKDAAASPAAAASLLGKAPGGFELYSGDDVFTLPLLAIGAVGTISVASHWTGTLQGQMVSAFVKGDVEEAQRINARLLPSFHYETGDDAPNPIPSKAMMRVLGLPAGQCRLPLGPAPDGLEDEARRILADLGSDAPRG
jgi:4-hydroxy-tetrahydrodipicolinate synthase